MTTRGRLLVPAALAVLVMAGGLLLAGGLGPGDGPGGTGLPGSSGHSGSPGAGASGEPAIAPTPTPRPAEGGTELYGFLPYWQMNAGMAAYMRSTPLSTVALFSVSARTNGSLNTKGTGYRRITGPIGRQLIDDAHDRRARVDLVFTSFGADRNGVFFGRLAPRAPASSPGMPGESPGLIATPGIVTTPFPAASAGPGPTAAPWHRTVGELVALAVQLGVDGINVDVEAMQAEDRDSFGMFLVELRAALVAAIPSARLTVSTEAGMRGTGNAVVAKAAGADRLFLMGYDYHFSTSQPGATAPIDRDDGLYTLRWSIDRYVDAGIPRDSIVLGLPLYGMQWRLTSPSRTALVIGEGVTWVPSRHRDSLLDPAFHAGLDPLENAQVVWEPDGGEWLVTYYDSPATLRPKLALAIDNGLAGAGFWAMGYERGLPGYLELMRDFRAGDVDRSEAPPRQSSRP